MLSIQQELIQLKKERAEKYILISDFLDFLKFQNPNTNYPEIAMWLLIKLRDNDIRNSTEDLWEDYAFKAWNQENGINVFSVPQSLDLPPVPKGYELFFNTLCEVRDKYTEYESSIFGNDKCYTITGFFNSSQRREREYKNLSVERKRLEELLSIEIPVTKPFDDVKETSISVAMALTKTDEFIKNTDINKSPIGTAERLVFEETIAKQQEEIARLKQQLETLQTQSKPMQPPTEEPQDDNSKPCHLNKFVNPDPLAIAIEIRNTEWKDYSDDKPIRSSAQIVNSFRRKYPNVTTTLMQKIENVACPIDRSRNK